MECSIAANGWRGRACGALAALLSLGAICTGARAAPYVPEPTWNSGLMYIDNFAAGGYDYRRGQKITEGDNGDVIVAGIVPGIGAAAGHTKLGLVRYNHAGVRQTWSNAGANGYSSNQYVIAPCAKPSFCGDDKNVKRIQRYGDHIFVLMDAEGQVNIALPWNPPIYFPGPTSAIYVLGMDGSLLSRTIVDDNSATPYGGGIALFEDGQFPNQTTTLMYAGMRINNDYWGTFRKYEVESNGTLTSLTDVLEPDFCSTSCSFSDIGVASTFATRRLYVSGSKYHGDPGSGQIGWSAGWDVFVGRINSNGAPVASFGTNGVVTTEGIGIESGGQKIAVTGGGAISNDDEIYVLANVKLTCKDGISILKLDHTGARASTFGINGLKMYGGSNETNMGLCNQGWDATAIRADYPTDLIYSNGLLGVSGYNVYSSGPACAPGQPCPEQNVDGEVAVIDANTGAINSFRGYAYSDTVGGPRSRLSGFWGITSAGDGTFSVAGDVRYFETAPADRRGRTMFATLRVAPQGDVIFKNGFEKITP